MTIAKRQDVAQVEDHAPPGAVSETAAVISMIERAARDPSVNIDKLERLLKMRQDIREENRRELAEQAKLAFNRAMIECQSKLPQVVRNAENTQTKSVYATLDAIGNAIDPIIAAHGFVQSFGFGDSPKEGHYQIACRTSHTEGHEQLDHIDMPIDNAGPNGTVNKTKPHALASTASYGRRILTCLIFNVKTKKGMPDDDGNAAGASLPISDEQFTQLRQLMIDAKSNEVKFLEYFKIEAVSDLPASKFQKAVDELKAAIEWQKKAKKS